MGLIRSPDGRVWKLDRVIWVDPDWVTYLLLLPLGVWIVERGLHAFRPFIRAETEGPPHELLMWRPGSRFAYGRVERRIAETIRAGRPETDVKGAPLVGSG